MPWLPTSRRTKTPAETGRADLADLHTVLRIIQSHQAAHNATLATLAQEQGRQNRAILAAFDGLDTIRRDIAALVEMWAAWQANGE
jgi:hypothetical protein